MSRKLLLVAGVLAGMGMGSALAGEAAPSSSQTIVLRRCEIEYKRSSLIGVAHMGTTTTSVLQDCLVKLGDRVEAGQVLGRIMDRDIKAELDLRTVEADNLLALHINEAKAGIAANKLKRTQKLQNRNTLYVPAEERANQELEMSAANLEIEESRYELRLAEIKRRQAETLLRSREYVSPHNGVVVEIHKEQGEAVLLSEPVFRVVEVDWVKVTGYLNLPDFWRVRPGLEVRITPEVDGDELPVEREDFAGRIVFVDRRIDPSTRTCKVVAEVANRDLLLASGLEARMEISLAGTPKEESAAAAEATVPKAHRSVPVSHSATTNAAGNPLEPRTAKAP